MYEKSVKIMNKTGLHARPATQFVQTASRFKSEITLIKDGKGCNAKSIISLLGMAVNNGSVITIRAEGEDEIFAVDAMVELVKNLAE